MKHTLGKNPLVIVKYQITTEITGAVLINLSRTPEPPKFLHRRELQFDTGLFYGYFKSHVASPDNKMSQIQILQTFSLLTCKYQFSCSLLLILHLITSLIISAELNSSGFLVQ